MPKIHPVFKSKVFFILASIVLVLFLILDAKQYKQHQMVAQEISSLKKQQSQLQQQNQELQSAVNNWQSNPGENAEKVARQQFNMQRPGEQVFSFSQPQTDSGSATSSASSSNSEPGNNNIKKWFDYFFQFN